MTQFIYCHINHIEASHKTTHAAILKRGPIEEWGLSQWRQSQRHTKLGCSQQIFSIKSIFTFACFSVHFDVNLLSSDPTRKMDMKLQSNGNRIPTDIMLPFNGSNLMIPLNASENIIIVIVAGDDLILSVIIPDTLLVIATGVANGSEMNHHLRWPCDSSVTKSNFMFDMNDGLSLEPECHPFC